MTFTSVHRLCWMHRAVLASMAISSRASCTSWALSFARQQHSNRFRRPLSTTMSAVIPRAAVSVVVRSSSSAGGPTTYVLVQRGKEPNKGMWSLPGGKIESGESTLEAAQRELLEETQLTPQEWHDGPFRCTDSIHWNKAGGVEYHYVIAQCFCTLETEQALVPSDDAADAKWLNLEEIKRAFDQGKVTPGVVQVVQRSEEMYQKGLLPTTAGSTYSN